MLKKPKYLPEVIFEDFPSQSTCKKPKYYHEMVFEDFPLQITFKKPKYPPEILFEDFPLQSTCKRPKYRPQVLFENFFLQITCKKRKYPPEGFWESFTIILEVELRYWIRNRDRNFQWNFMRFSQTSYETLWDSTECAGHGAALRASWNYRPVVVVSQQLFRRYKHGFIQKWYWYRKYVMHESVPQER